MDQAGFGIQISLDFPILHCVDILVFPEMTVLPSGTLFDAQNFLQKFYHCPSTVASVVNCRALYRTDPLCVPCDGLMHRVARVSLRQLRLVVNPFFNP